VRRLLLAGCSALVLLLAGCGTDDGSNSPEPSESSASPRPTLSSTATAKPSPKPDKTPQSVDPSTSRAAEQERDVLAISVDGLNVDAVLRLGPAGAPAFHRLLGEGAATLNARTEVEQTVTLPNHAGMLTGRRIDPRSGGHGVTWNEEVPGSMVPGQGNGVESVFDVVHAAGGRTALFAGKDKFALFERSWDEAVDEFEVDLDNDRLVDEVRADLTTQERRLTFLHIALPDTVGHAAGWMTPAYVEAVRHTDGLLGELLGTIDATPRLHRRTVVVLTADHGGVPGARDHADAGAYADFRVPFVIWGAGVQPGDLYELNPDYHDPGTQQPSYDGPQPIRNGDLANVVTELLGLGPVPGSQLDARQDLDVASP
jgi:hypothetical protein